MVYKGRVYRDCIAEKVISLSIYVCIRIYMYINIYRLDGYCVAMVDQHSSFSFVRLTIRLSLLLLYIDHCVAKHGKREGDRRNIVCVRVCIQRVRTNQGNRKTLGVVCSGCHVSLSKSDLFVDHFRRNSIIFKILDFTIINRL